MASVVCWDPTSVLCPVDSAFFTLYIYVTRLPVRVRTRRMHSSFSEPVTVFSFVSTSAWKEQNFDFLAACLFFLFDCLDILTDTDEKPIDRVL